MKDQMKILSVVGWYSNSSEYTPLCIDTGHGLCDTHIIKRGEVVFIV